MSPFLGRTLVTKISFSQLQEEGRRTFSSRALFALKSSTASLLWKIPWEMLLSYFSFASLSMRSEYFAQNTDAGKMKRLFQPPCMEPISATPGRLSLPCTISHPQAAPAAAWPGFRAASAQSCFLCLVNPFVSPMSGAAQWAGAPNKSLQPKQLCQRAFSLMPWARVPWCCLCRCWVAWWHPKSSSPFL